MEAYVRDALTYHTGKPEPQAGIPAIPDIDFSQFGEIERQPLQRIQRLSSAHLHRAWLKVPYVTQFESADITDLDAFRKSASEQQGIKLTLLPFLIKAVSHTLAEFPRFNASITGPTGYIIKPGHIKLLDCEVELVLVLGKHTNGPVTVIADILHDYVAGPCIGLAKQHHVIKGDAPQ